MPKVIKSVAAPKHSYTQKQLDTLAVTRPILYKSVVAEGYEIVPEPQRVVVARPVAEFATGLATHNPKVEQKAKKTMTTENTVETPAAPVTKKAAAKKVVKKVVKKTTTTVTTPKAAGKKATTKKSAPSKDESTPRGDSIRIRTFVLLSKNPEGLTGAQIKESLELGGIPSLLKDEGVCDAPRIKRVSVEGVRGVCYQLTALGRKAVEKGLVDENAAPAASGQEWPEGR